MKILWRLACSALATVLMAVGSGCLAWAVWAVCEMGNNPAGLMGYLVLGCLTFALMVIGLCSILGGVTIFIKEW